MESDSSDSSWSYFSFLFSSFSSFSLSSFFFYFLFFTLNFFLILAWKHAYPPLWIEWGIYFTVLHSGFQKTCILSHLNHKVFFPLLKESIQTQQDQLELGSDPFFFFFFFPHSTLNFQNTEVTSNIMSINISCIILVSMDTTRISGITICCTRLTSTLSGSSVSLCRVAVVELGTTIKVNPS